MSNIVAVEFRNEKVWAIEDGEGVLVAVKPISESLGLAWHGQFERIKRDPVLSEGVRMIRIPSPGGDQETVCLPLDLVPGWLFKIEISRVKDAAMREKILDYQRECYATLFRHFFGGGAAPAEVIAAVMPGNVGRIDGRPLAEWDTWLSVVNNARRIYGNGSARAIWEMSPLPQVPQPETVGENDPIGEFLAAATVRKPGARVPAGALYAAYCRWCRARETDAAPQAAFGRELSRRNFPPSRNSRGLVDRCNIALAAPTIAG